MRPSKWTAAIALALGVACAPALAVADGQWSAAGSIPRVTMRNGGRNFQTGFREGSIPGWYPAPWGGPWAPGYPAWAYPHGWRGYPPYPYVCPYPYEYRGWYPYGYPYAAPWPPYPFAYGGYCP